MLSLLLLLVGPAHADPQPAFDLPNQADRMRQLGVSSEQTAAALKSMQDAGLTAEQAQLLLLTANQGAEVHGPVPAFDILIQESLDLALRGADLAAAITRAHVETGQGVESIRHGPPAEGTGIPSEGRLEEHPPVPQQAPEPPGAPIEPSDRGVK